MANYAQGVHEVYSRSLASARVMDEAIDRFVASPTAPPLEAAKRVWLVARADAIVEEAQKTGISISVN